MNISNNTSSINAHQELLNNSSHNIANSNTKGFERTQTTIIGDSNEQPKATMEKEENNTPYSNTDLVKEMTDQIISYHAVGANSVAIKTKNEVEDTLLDIYA
jgi:flagellar hook protein FlgE